MTCAVFLDAGYIEKVLSKEHPGLRIDYGKLAHAMAGQEGLLRAYYYNCLPWLGEEPTDAEKERFQKKQAFFSALDHLPRFQVRLGKLALAGYSREGAPVYQQKRVDLMLGVDMTLLASKGKVTSIALFSGDSDTIPAIEAVKQEGVIVKLWHGALDGEHAPSRELYRMCDERTLASVARLRDLRQ
jgi:uncharacterized LabA/DUF88 family protein